jgi:hypothetical protein
VAFSGLHGHARVLCYVHFACADLDAGRQHTIQRSRFGACNFQPECFVSKRSSMLSWSLALFISRKRFYVSEIRAQACSGTALKDQLRVGVDLRGHAH